MSENESGCRRWMDRRMLGRRAMDIDPLRPDLGDRRQEERSVDEDKRKGERRSGKERRVGERRKSPEPAANEPVPAKKKARRRAPAPPQKS